MNAVRCSSRGKPDNHLSLNTVWIPCSPQISSCCKFERLNKGLLITESSSAGSGIALQGDR